MQSKIRMAARLALAVAVFAAAGCASYYQVKEPVGGTVYYTEKVEQAETGSVKFKDAKSGATVTIQNSAVKEISEEEFKTGVTGSPVKTPQPAPAPAPAAVK